MRKCVHFNGIMNKTCKAGIVYGDLYKNRLIEYMRHLPCFDDGTKGKCSCEKLRFPSEEEERAEKELLDAHMVKLSLGLVAVQPIRDEYRGRDYSGTLDCPVCKGVLHVRHAGYNGHIWVKCESKDCIAWIE